MRRFWRWLRGVFGRKGAVHIERDRERNRAFLLSCTVEELSEYVAQGLDIAKMAEKPPAKGPLEYEAKRRGLSGATVAAIHAEALSFEEQARLAFNARPMASQAAQNAYLANDRATQQVLAMMGGYPVKPATHDAVTAAMDMALGRVNDAPEPNPFYGADCSWEPNAYRRKLLERGFIRPSWATDDYVNAVRQASETRAQRAS